MRFLERKKFRQNYKHLPDTDHQMQHDERAQVMEPMELIVATDLIVS